MKRLAKWLMILAACVLLAAASARADVVLDWNVIAVNTIAASGQSPFAQARYGAIVQVAVFEAVNAITQEYQPYLGSIVAPNGASADAAAIAAAYRVLITYFPASAPTLDPARENSLALITDGQAKDDGIATGEAAANAIIALRANDGWSPPQLEHPARRPRQMAGNAKLSGGEWSSFGICSFSGSNHPIRYRERWRLSARSAASTDEQQIREGLQRGHDGRRP